MLVSSFVINVLSPVCNCTDTTQAEAWDGRTDRSQLCEEPNLHQKAYENNCLSSTDYRSVFPVILRQDLEAEFYADAQLWQRTCPADREAIAMICKWVSPQNGINGVHFR